MIKRLEIDKKLKKYLIYLLLWLLPLTALSQGVAINDVGANPNAFSILDVNISTGGKGLLIPRMIWTNKPTGIGATEDGLLIYSTDGDGTNGPGFYRWNGTSWSILFTSSNGWSLLGNANTNVGTNYIGTSDNNALSIRTNGTERIRVANTTGYVGVNVVPTNAQFESTNTSTTVDFSTIRGNATGNAKTYGVLGTTTSTATNASGVKGYASSVSGSSNGVWGDNSSTFGVGVYGSALETTSINTIGVYGVSVLGTGVLGSTSGTGGWGVWGNASGNDSYGVIGTVASISGTVNMGVIGNASGATTNFGVYSNQAMGVGEYIADLSNGIYNDIAIGDAGFVVFTRNPIGAGNTTITGFTGGYDGRILYVYWNSTNRNIQFNHDNGSAAANRIYTNTAANVTSTNNAAAIFIYSASLSRWILISWLP